MADFVEKIVVAVLGAGLALFAQWFFQRSTRRKESYKLKLSKLEELLYANYRIKELHFDVAKLPPYEFMKKCSEVIALISVNILLYHPELSNHMHRLTGDILELQEVVRLSDSAGVLDKETRDIFIGHTGAIFEHTDQLTDAVSVIGRDLAKKLGS